MSDDATKKTPLYDEHVRCGAKVIPFGGWLMPVQYTSIVEEHQAVRKNAGVFDISHMGQFIVRGARAGAWLNTMLTNNIDKLEVGMGQYTFLLNERGGIIDDLIAYRIAPEEFLLVVNAARAEEDFAWLDRHRSVAAAVSAAKDIDLTNRSADFAGLAVQGPRIIELLQKLFGDKIDIPTRNHIKQFELDGMPLQIARTGYTGEDGVEIFFPARDAAKVWNTLLEKGEPLGLKPCGLGARDTLRLEMCYPLNGSDLSPERNPIEAGLGFFVDLGKPQFIGRDALVRAKEKGTPQRLIAFRMTEKGASRTRVPPPRPHYAVWHGTEKIGEVTSGTSSPSLNYGIGMAYIDTHFSKIGNEIEIEIRGQKFPATIEKKPLYKKTS